MSDYYGELGVAPDASESELRRAYREKARQLHPDLHADGGAAGPEDDAMRRLNEAWRVLGDPQSRRRYDQLQRVTEEEAAIEDVIEMPVAGHRLLRSWWLVAIAVLAGIFVITAYARRPATPNQPPGSGRPPADQCLGRFPGYEAYVSCSQPNIGRVVTVHPETGASASCPAGSVAHPVLGRAEVACLAGSG